METTLRIPDQIYGQHRIINTLDNQKKRKHSSFSSELLEEEIGYRITQKKTKQKKNNQRCHSNPFTSVYVLFELTFWLLIES